MTKTKHLNNIYQKKEPIQGPKKQAHLWHSTDSEVVPCILIHMCHSSLYRLFVRLHFATDILVPSFSLLINVQVTMCRLLCVQFVGDFRFWNIFLKNKMITKSVWMFTGCIWIMLIFDLVLTSRSRMTNVLVVPWYWVCWLLVSELWPFI